MHAVWDRLEQLALLAGGQGFGRASTAAPVAVLLDPDLPSVGDLVPERFACHHAAWLPADLRDRAMLCSQRSMPGSDHVIESEDGQRIRGTTLGVGSLHLGILLTPRDAPLPWTPATAARLGEALAAEVAPRLATAWQQARARRDGDGLLQLELERLGQATGEVAIVRMSHRLCPSSSFRGAVSLGERAASYLGAVTGGPSPAGIATLAAASLRRWLADLPDPDPATVIDAVCVDLAPVLGHLAARLEVVACVPVGPLTLRVNSSTLPVVAFDRAGQVTGWVTATGRSVTNLDLGRRTSADLTVPAGGYAVVVAGVEDPRVVARYGVQRRGAAPGALSEVAARFGDAIAKYGHGIDALIVHAAPWT